MRDGNDGYREAEYIAKTHRCPDCEDNARLVVRWDFTSKRNIAQCGGCGRTDGFRRRESITAQWKRNPDSIPVAIADKLERKYGYRPMTEQGLVKSTETAMVARIEQARWLADLKPQDRQSLAHLAVKYGLDPLMKEMTLYEGQPYISIAGLIRIAHRQKMFAGLEDRPMTTDERQRYGYKAPFCWLVSVYRKDWKCVATGTGTADPANPFRNNPIERTRPEWMARSRAIRQALKLAFPHSLPFEEVESAEEFGIDPETGEILDGSVVDQQEAPTDNEQAPISVESEADYADSTDVTDCVAIREEIEAALERIGNPLTSFVKWFGQKYALDYATTDDSVALRAALTAVRETEAKKMAVTA